MDTLRTGRTSRKHGLIVVTLALIATTLVVFILHPSRSAAQGPLFPAAWEAALAPFGGQEG